MKHLFTVTLFALLTACAAPSVNRSLEASYDTVTAYVSLTHRALITDRISIVQAERASANAKSAKAMLDQAAAALAACNAPPTQCASYEAIMSGVTPALIQFEQALKSGD